MGADPTALAVIVIHSDVGFTKLHGHVWTELPARIAIDTLLNIDNRSHGPPVPSEEHVLGLLHGDGCVGNIFDGFIIIHGITFLIVILIVMSRSNDSLERGV